MSIIVESALDEWGEVDFELSMALDKIAKARGLGITRDRDINSIVRDADGSVVGGTYTSFDGDNYTFDVVVSESAEGTGVGRALLDDVIQVPSDLFDVNPDFTMRVDVVSASMRAMLERRGFGVIQNLGPANERWLMEPINYERVGRPELLTAGRKLAL